MTTRKKQLQEDSTYDCLDVDNNGVVTDNEMQNAEAVMELQNRKQEIENEDKKQDAQRSMAWFALFGMLLYPFTVVLADALGLYQAATIIGNMASIYFVSVAAIVSAFYGTQAYVSKGK
jgi:hypothetical protein